MNGLLVVDLQYSFKPSQDIIDYVRDVTDRYAVVVATRFNPVGGCHSAQMFYEPMDNDGLIDVSHNLAIDRSVYGLDTACIDALKSFTDVKEWGIIGGHTGLCLLACALSLWDACIPFHVVRPLCLSAPNTSSAAIDSILQDHFNT